MAAYSLSHIMRLSSKSSFSSVSTQSSRAFLATSACNPQKMEFGERLRQNTMRNPKNMEEIEKRGMVNHLKKSRLYAQYNYQEWRYPKRERAVDISCSRMVFKEYNEKKLRLMQKPKERMEEFRINFMSHREIKKKIPSFHRKRFPTEAQDIYVQVHNLLNTENWTLAKQEHTEEKLHDLVTEFAYLEMVQGLDTKTVSWKFVETIEPPRTVQVIVQPMMHEQNLYGQVTVRFHTKQLLTIHDRFGRLMLGSPDVPREVLEYVVFERQISNQYGKWRIHSKKLSVEQKPEELEKTISIVKQKPVRSAADDWHKQEEDDCVYKWYPERESYVIPQLEKLKRQKRNKDYWVRRRKRHVLKAIRTPKTRMKRKTSRLVTVKRHAVVDLRERGELPLPE